MRLFPVLLLLSVSVGCGRRPDGAAVAAVRPVKVTEASGAAFLRKDFAGMATPDDAVTLAFKLSGQVSELPVAQGMQVLRGDLLAELDPRDVELQVSATRSAFEEARSQQQRMERLLAHEAVSRQDAEAARTRFAQARAAYNNALDLLNDTKLKAPFAGVIEATYVDNYERVQAGQAILRLVAPRTTTVKFTMPERGLASLADSSTRFEVEFDNFRGMRFPARLKDYARTSSDASGFPVSLTLGGTDTLRYDISPGMSCTVTMFSADPVPDAVSLPLSAIYAPTEGGTYVWVVTAGDRVERRTVVLGELFGSDRVVIDSGVAPGETVVTAGVYRLHSGDEVRILR
ncbi:MAG: efflux RND transporter periplasmic adaptor subunit [Alistipes sp.]|nr:efflux RND transporter periplasmic adaptor subunit [Alistipes sp.]